MRLDTTPINCPFEDDQIFGHLGVADAEAVVGRVQPLKW
jgi:hypothetical protein